MTTAAANTIDWSKIDQDVHCPMCDYNLRGLAEPRCPECGYRFEWKDLLDGARALHPYLFEHRPRHNVWSLARTQIGGLFPRRFWSGLNPGQRSSPRRLMLYYVLSIAPVLLLIFGSVAVVFGWDYLEARTGRQSAIARGMAKWMTVAMEKDYLDRFYPLPGGQRLTYLSSEILVFAHKPAGMRVLLAWPWASFLTLMIFRISMGRARVRPIHVLRCIIYSADFTWLIVLGAFATSLAVAATRPVIPLNLDDGFRLMWIAPLVFLPIFTWRLATAYRLYLKFDHPISTVLAAQLIVALVAADYMIWLTP